MYEVWIYFLAFLRKKNTSVVLLFFLSEKRKDAFVAILFYLFEKAKTAVFWNDFLAFKKKRHSRSCSVSTFLERGTRHLASRAGQAGAYLWALPWVSPFLFQGARHQSPVSLLLADKKNRSVCRKKMKNEKWKLKKMKKENEKWKHTVWAEKNCSSGFSPGCVC